MRPSALDENWIEYAKALKALEVKKKKGSKFDIEMAEKRVAMLKDKLK